MYDQHSLFCLFFFIFSYKLLFWSDRSISIGALVLTLCCALSITQLFYPHSPLISFAHLGETLHHTSPSFRVMPGVGPGTRLTKSTPTSTNNPHDSGFSADVVPRVIG